MWLLALLTLSTATPNSDSTNLHIALIGLAGAALTAFAGIYRQRARSAESPPRIPQSHPSGPGSALYASHRRVEDIERRLDAIEYDLAETLRRMKRSEDRIDRNTGRIDTLEDDDNHDDDPHRP